MKTEYIIYFLSLQKVKMAEKLFKPYYLTMVYILTIMPFGFIQKTQII